MKILSLSDIVIPFIYSPQIRNRFKGVNIILGCGDLPYEYLEYVVSTLNAPLFYVRGNHDREDENGENRQHQPSIGGNDLHKRVIEYKGVLLAGIEGSLRYREGPFQYNQQEMWAMVMQMVPRLLYNRLVFGRYLDVFISHAPPRGIHDHDDLTHQGIDAFRWLIERFRPSYHIHGHTHVYRPDEATETSLGHTKVINTYGYRETILSEPQTLVSRPEQS